MQGSSYLTLARQQLQIGNIHKASALFEKALRRNKNNTSILLEYGNALHQHGLYSQAIETYQLIANLQPDRPEAWCNMANSHADSGHTDQAIQCHTRALSLDPAFALSWKELGILHQQSGNLPLAISHLEKSIQLLPTHAPSHTSLAGIRARLGYIAEAIQGYELALRHKPDLFEALSNLLFFSHFSNDTPLEIIRASQERWNLLYASSQIPLPTPPPPNPKIHIGFCSPDFRDHVIGSYMLALLPNLDSHRFTTYLYSDATLPDATTTALQQYANVWLNTHAWSHERLAEQIRKDGIHILIDLNNHMAGNRLRTFALKPAPIQITQMGFPFGTGIQTMDYRISDGHMDPPGISDSIQTETILRLSRCPFCYLPTPNSPPVQPPPSIHNGHITFGSLNNFAKISRETLALWKAVLDAVPNSQLLILIPGGETSRELVLPRFHEQSIPMDRIRFTGLVPRTAFLELFNQIDIHLDTTPYDGGITTLESLWMGVPVVNLIGQRPPGRHGLSILSGIQKTDWLANTPEQYIHIATHLSSQPSELQTIRTQLRQQMLRSPLMDTQNYGAAFSQIYSHIWETHPS